MNKRETIIHAVWAGIAIAAFAIGLAIHRSKEVSVPPSSSGSDARAGAVTTTANAGTGGAILSGLPNRGVREPSAYDSMSAGELIELSEEVSERLEDSADPFAVIDAMPIEEKVAVMRGALLDMADEFGGIGQRKLLEKNFFGIPDHTYEGFLSFFVAAEAADSHRPAIRQEAFSRLGISAEEQTQIETRTMRAKSRRNAQNIVSVYSAATAAGADFSEIDGAMTAIRKIKEGVYGGAEGGFDTTMFKVPNLSEAEMREAASHIRFVDGMINYSPADE